mmetsp:Transcript_20950/g.67483  ORF Transcript_20950/g.67483 Transcript_20950/m.67483 type:complete len:158 (+) Transcript_20950:237-710(+)
MPAEGVEKREYYNRKFGASRVAGLEANLKRVFAAEGLSVNFGGKTGPTMASHRLIAYAETFGCDKQNALVEELFQNYFDENKYLNDDAVLLAAADKVGVTGADAIVKDPQAYRDTVIDQYRTYARGISGVPHFLIGDMELSGAQEPDVFADALARAA